MKAADRARQALGHRDLRELLAVIPAADRANPAELRGWLMAASNTRLARTEAFRTAYGAVSEWAGTSALADRAAAIYHNPKLRAEFGADRLEAALRDPAGAYAELVGMSAKGRLSPAASEALGVLAEAREVAVSDGVAWEGAAAAMPHSASEVDREAAALVAASSTRRLTATEDARLRLLYESKAAREEATAGAAEAAAARPKAPTRREELVAKSVTKGLSRGEEAELKGLYRRDYPEEDDGFAPAASVPRARGATRRDQLLERSATTGLSPGEEAELRSIYRREHPEGSDVGSGGGREADDEDEVDYSDSTELVDDE